MNDILKIDMPWRLSVVDDKDENKIYFRCSVRSQFVNPEQAEIVIATACYSLPHQEEKEARFKAERQTQLRTQLNNQVAQFKHDLEKFYGLC